MRWTRVWTSSHPPKTLFFLIPGMDSVCISRCFRSDTLRQVPLFGYVRKNPIDYFELHNRIIFVYRVRKHQFPKLHKFGDIEECIIWNPTPQNTVLFTLWVNSVIVLNKIT